jgi:predicted DNA-binding transcriptional regulator AlpA
VTTASNVEIGAELPRPRSGAQELLSIPEVIAELGVPRSTFYRWRQMGVGPKAIKLPNGQVRIRRTVLEAWLRSLEGDLT